MAHTLTGSTVTVSLPGDLMWEDEWKWQPVVGQVERSLAGTVVEQTATMSGGRPITLVGDEEIWLDKVTVEQLINLVSQNETMTLTLEDGRSFSVRFRYEEAPPVELEPVAHNLEIYSNVRIKLREVP